MPLRSLLESGVDLAASSDHPVATFAVLVGLRAAAIRRTRTGAALEPDQAITVAEALHAYTLGAARALGVEAEAGSLAPGKRADLVLLSEDAAPDAEGANGGKASSAYCTPYCNHGRSGLYAGRPQQISGALHQI